jgi:cytoskeletal protein RodZ
MREAARALDDVSDHLGEVLRRADELLADWSRFGAQVRTQVDREAAAIGEVIDGAVTRAASSGLDRAIADRLRALTTELERLEQRARAASRVVAEQREGDRRVLWIVVAGIVLANALLVALLLRKPDAAPVAEPIRIESTAAPQPPETGPTQSTTPAAGSAEPASTASIGSATAASEAKGAGAGSSAPNAGSNAAGANTGSNGASAKPGASAAPNALAKSTPPLANAAKPDAGAAKPTPSPSALPPKGSTSRPHKKLP